jgi:retron-type reverse transcriptase
VLENNLIGTPQGSIISPILANIFLHQLDTFVEKLRKDFDVEIKPRVSPEYTKIRYQKRLAERSNDTLTAKRLHLDLLNTGYTLYNDLKYKRLYYVRYADD